MEASNDSILANDLVAPDGSVVESGSMLADAVLHSLETMRAVDVDLRGVRGASSSYFNVFLRRIQEAGQLDAVDTRIRLRFTSRAQEDVFRRSLESVTRGPRTPPNNRAEAQKPNARADFLRRLATRLRFWRQTR